MACTCKPRASTVDWNYVTDIPIAYEPRAFKSRAHLVKILKSKIIVNESKSELTASQIELLALGFNFITSSAESSLHLFRKWSPEQGTDESLLDACASLINQSNFYVIGAAKGGAFVAWDSEKYEKEAFRVLQNIENFETIFKRRQNELEETMRQRVKNSNHVDRMIEQRLFLAERALFHQCIGHREATMVKKWTRRFPFVLFKPKIHKPALASTGTFQSKPTVHFDWGPTAPFDDYLTRLTSPILSLLPGSLCEASDIFAQLVNCNGQEPETGQGKGLEEYGERQIAKDLCCGEHHDCQEGWLVFKSIFASSWKSSLPFDMCVGASVMLYGEYYGDLCRRAMLRNDRPPPDPALFKTLLKFVVNHSYLNFQNKLVVRQIKGAPLNSGISTFIAQCVLFVSTSVLIERPPSWIVLYRFYQRNLFFITCNHPCHSLDWENEYLKLQDGNPWKDLNFLKSIIKSLRSIPRTTIEMDQVFQLGDVIVNIKKKLERNGKGPKTCSIVTMSPVMKLFLDRYPLFHRTSLHPFEQMVDIFSIALLHLRKLCSTPIIFQSALKYWCSEFYLRDFSQKEWNQIFTNCRNAHIAEKKQREEEQKMLPNFTIPKKSKSKSKEKDKSASKCFNDFTKPYNIALFGPKTPKQSMIDRVHEIGASLGQQLEDKAKYGVTYKPCRLPFNSI